MSKLVRELSFSNIDKFLTNLSPPDWKPSTTIAGTILDKFGVRGISECCKGSEGSQVQTLVQAETLECKFASPNFSNNSPFFSFAETG